MLNRVAPATRRSRNGPGGIVCPPQSAILAPPDKSSGQVGRCVDKQADRLADHLDWEIIKRAAAAIERKEKTVVDIPIRNINRTVGAILSNRIVGVHGRDGLPDGTLEIVATGTAGQSFGAFLAPGVTLRLIGDANDYLGKGLSGGRIILQPPPTAPFMPQDNIIAGNTLLYGATGGEVFINGQVGERFAVRNSGVTAVVEGVGDHGCEYMTGGRVVIIGRTGRNFAAGMSGGIAYVFDDQQLFDTLCNLDMVDLESVYQPEDVEFLHTTIQRHYDYTSSPRAKWILDNWRDLIGRFVKVMPIDYRQSLERMRQQERRGADFTPATEEVFNG